MLLANQIAGFLMLYLKKEVILDLDQHQIFRQVDSIVLWTDMPKVPKITSLQYFRIILRKTWGKHLLFWTTISFKVFYKLIPAIIIHGQSSQNNKFQISLQCLKKEGRDEVDFSHANKHQHFPQVDFIECDGLVEWHPKHPK